MLDNNEFERMRNRIEATLESIADHHQRHTPISDESKVAIFVLIEITSNDVEVKVNGWDIVDIAWTMDSDEGGIEDEDTAIMAERENVETDEGYESNDFIPESFTVEVHDREGKRTSVIDEE